MGTWWEGFSNDWRLAHVKVENIVVFIEGGDNLKMRENRNFAGKREGRSCPHEDNILSLPDMNLLSQAFDNVWFKARCAIPGRYLLKKKGAAPHHGMFRSATRKSRPETLKPGIRCTVMFADGGASS
jgi:hypothetical protein